MNYLWRLEGQGVKSAWVYFLFLRNNIYLYIYIYICCNNKKIGNTYYIFLQYITFFKFILLLLST